jgi:hypothetical protein
MHRVATASTASRVLAVTVVTFTATADHALAATGDLRRVPW